MKQLAIIGPTASGKSDLAISIAQKNNAYILSIDSLSIYKEIDIVSAKPSQSELSSVKHFGINEIYPNAYFSVDIFIKLYKNILQKCKEDKKNLVIVGGTSFYLKSLMQGLSPLPKITHTTQELVKEKLLDLEEYHSFLTSIDPKHMAKINKNDSYRIEKAALIYEASQLTPSQWFAENPPQVIANDLSIFNIDVERDILRKRISKRTNKMLELGLIDEVCYLEQKYTRLPNAMKSIGIVEVLDFLDAKIDKDVMLEQISTHTAQLAKRQQTFNKTQFQKVYNAKLEDLEDLIEKNMFSGAQRGI